jgi:hypothetical protein
VAETEDRRWSLSAKGKREHSDYGKIGAYIRTETIPE